MILVNFLVLHTSLQIHLHAASSNNDEKEKEEVNDDKEEEEANDDSVDVPEQTLNKEQGMMNSI